ncbi:MAG: hypothetical protein S4CHLAM81_08510 [Chlamydiales bacterium]|nr:hypothetical protein [Chlamydiales bacterium]MCH9635633.1 hypothetical protein [Chlamydiales bacterium]
MFHAFAHTCHQEKGHQLYYHTVCQKAVESLGLQYRAYIPRKNNLPQVPVEWKLHFPPPYSREHKRDYLQSCYRLFKEAEEPRIFFIETIMRRDMRYFSMAALRYGRREDKICMLFRDNNLLKKGRDRQEVLLFLRLLRLKFKENLSLFTDTSNLSTFFSEKTGYAFHTLPIPHFDLDPSDECEPIVLLPGEPRREKGGHLLRDLAGSFEGMLFACSESMPVGDLHFSNSLPREEYVGWLKRSSVIILPYEASQYRYRSSGIFVEGISLGKLVLVPDGCWMADELRKYDLEDLIVDFGKPLGQQTKKMCENLTIREKLGAMQRSYLALHTPESFGRKLDEVAHLSTTVCTVC